MSPKIIFGLKSPKYGSSQALIGSPRYYRQAQVTAALHVVWYYGFEHHFAQDTR
jgi:hypothetical protein